MKNRCFDNYETGREKAILFGIPKSMIKGILISRKYGNNLYYIKNKRIISLVIYLQHRWNFTLILNTCYFFKKDEYTININIL